MHLTHLNMHLTDLTLFGKSRCDKPDVSVNVKLFARLLRARTMSTHVCARKRVRVRVRAALRA
jgi:hypothetical protein